MIARVMFMWIWIRKWDSRTEVILNGQFGRFLPTWVNLPPHSDVRKKTRVAFLLLGLACGALVAFIGKVGMGRIHRGVLLPFGKVPANDFVR